MALSGAAILAVYAAGYARTQAAAEQWRAGAQAPTATGPAAADAASPASPAGPATPPAFAATPPPPAPAPSFTYGYGDDDRRDGEQEGGERERRRAGASPTPQQAQPPQQTPPPRTTQPVAPASTAPPATSSAGGGSSQAAAASPYKDGVYSGTGWSRHGSVSVAITIRNGRMTSAVITGCTTHYPCADVAPMPAEVLAAQSVQVDVVSGATDSSMAFLGAVQQALAQAARG
jgi:uncharacterized protein with FMN-binding domain